MADFNPQDYMAMMQNNTAAANAFNAAQSQKQMDFQVAQNAKAMDFNHREAELNRNWQKMMSDTAHQREVQDLISAGLNPVLSALGGNGASVGSGSAASVSALQGSRAEADTSINASMAGLLSTMISGQTQRDVANINAAAAMHNAELSADAMKYSANTSYAGLMQQLAHSELYPTTMWGAISSAFQSIFGDGTALGDLGSSINGLVDWLKDPFGHPNGQSGSSVDVSRYLKGMKDSFNEMLNTTKNVSKSTFDKYMNSNKMPNAQNPLAPVITGAKFLYNTRKSK